MQTTTALRELHETQRSLSPLATMLSKVETADEPSITALVVAARVVQRLLESVVAEITLLNNRCELPLPTESLLSGDGTIPRSQAQVEAERGRTVGDFPRLGDAYRAGAAHSGNVDVLARVTRSMTDQEVDALREHDRPLAEAAGRLSEESFRKRVTRLRDKIRGDAGQTAADQATDDSFARIAPNRERTGYRLLSSFDPVRGAALKAALSRESKFLTEHPELCRDMTPAQITAQALHDLVMRGDSINRSATPRASVRIHVLSDRDTLASGPHEHSIAENFDGLPIAPAALGRLCCEATLRRIDTAPDGRVHVSKPTRSTSEAQRMALRALYPNCPISGAGWESIEIHHVIFFSESKRTVLDELVPVSRRWHHLIHDGGWKLEMAADRTLRLSRPDGTLFKVIAPPIPINRADHSLAA